MPTLESTALTPAQARQLCRYQRYTAPTAGIAPRYIQANMVILPAAHAPAFETYCRLNPQPCPLLEKLPPGIPFTSLLAAGADVRTDLPRYRVHRPDLPPADCFDIQSQWRDDLVTFLLGCSFSFEQALLDAHLPVRHLEQNRNVPMYRTTRQTLPAPPFAGPLVVSMRPMPPDRIDEACRITQKFPRMHGAPIHHGDPALLGIRNLARPDWGDPVTLHHAEIPVFWACGVTSQTALEQALASSLLDLAITHAPGHMFLSDLLHEQL